MKIRCINLDWLEIFAEEPIDEPHDALYFRNKGYKVKERVYGTPQYRQMFTLIADDVELFEIRRDPYSIKSQGGIFQPNACHIRLCNRTCYEESPIDHLRAFMVAHDYTYKSISRIDIALDFNKFDNGEDPANFISRYMRGKVAKVNQCRVSAHGTDEWARRVFNSLKWGSPSSPVTTKLYNKTLELKQGEDKPYIRQAWEDAGLDPTKDVWRVEFSLSAQMQTLQSLKNGEMFKKSIVHYDSRDRLLKQFFILYHKYFDFRLLKVNRKDNGKLVYVRKYMCPRIDLLRYDNDLPFKPCRNVTKRKRPDRVYKMLINRLVDVVDKKDTSPELMQATQTIVAWLCEQMMLAVDEDRHIRDKHIADVSKIRETVERTPDEELQAAWFMQEYEMRILYHLMRKYGIAIPPPNAPF